MTTSNPTDDGEASDDPTITITARGRVEVTIRPETGGGALSVDRTREEAVEADIRLGTREVLNSEMIGVRKHRLALDRRAIAEEVCDRVVAGSDRPTATEAIDPLDWEVTIAAALDDWQVMALNLGELQRDFRVKKYNSAKQYLLSAAEHSPASRPLLAGINLCETFDADTATTRSDFIEALTADDEADPAADAAAAGEEVTADD